MNRYATLLIATLAVLGIADAAKADWGSLTYGGFQPWWNVLGIGKRHGQSPEERRLQRFWHDYYDAQRRYYKSLEHLDWVTYYKNHGQQINGGYAGGYGCGYGNCQAQAPIQFAPVTVSPQMGWANPMAGGCGAGGCTTPNVAQAGYQMGYYPMAYPGYMPQMPSGPVSPVGYSYGE
jgi:hypothetical protein